MATKNIIKNKFKKSDDEKQIFKYLGIFFNY